MHTQTIAAHRTNRKNYKEDEENQLLNSVLCDKENVGCIGIGAGAEHFMTLLSSLLLLLLQRK